MSGVGAMIPRIGCVLLVAWTTAFGTDAATLVESKEPGWPQWRGPRRDGISLETGLLRSWPAAGPRVLWVTTDLGRGYCAPVICRDRIYITGDVGEELQIFALDLDGKRVWKATNGRAWRGPYPGARASSAVDEGRLYHMNAHGRAASLDAETGQELWAVSVLDRFDGKTITWGLGECLLLVGDHVIVTPGGKKASMAALDKRTGETVWTVPPVLPESSEVDANDGESPESDSASYASPILLELGARRMIVGATSRHVIAVDASTGGLLWQRPLPTRFQVIGLTPVLCGDGVFMTAPDSPGGTLWRLLVKGDSVGVEKVWTADIDTCHGGVLPIGGLLVGSWYRHYNGWGAIDAATGETLYRTDELVMGSAIHAEGRYYILAQDGVMALVEADRDGLRIVSRFRLAEARRNDAWAHPVLLDGRLYLRYHERLECRDVRAFPERARGGRPEAGGQEKEEL